MKIRASLSTGIRQALTLVRFRPRFDSFGPLARAGRALRCECQPTDAPQVRFAVGA